MNPRRRTSAVLAIFALTVALCACHAQRVRNAPFRARPDTVKPGNLLGPFDGRVRDGASGDPVAGALVYATWSLQAGYGLTTPAGFREAITSSDANGNYSIPALDEVPGAGSARVVDFVLVVYKRGYVAYRSDRRFRDFGPRYDFSQRQNPVVLERWRADFSHVRHLRYLGGGGAIASLTTWEADEAAAELSGKRGLEGPRLATDIFPGERRVVAAQLLSEREILAITKQEIGFNTGPLGDEPDSDQYSSQHFRAVGQPESFDVAIRMWTVPAEDAVKRYQDLADTLPGVDERDEIADRSLRAVEGPIIGIAILDQARNIVVLVTCGKSQCADEELAVSLARKAHGTLQELSPVANREDGGRP